MGNSPNRFRGSAIWVAAFLLTIAFVTPVTAKKHGGKGVTHMGKQMTPIQMGSSGGWRFDLANGYCCGGTLGSLVTDGTTLYILSNFHVLAGDVVPGGNNLVAEAGNPIIHPGLIDVGCNQNKARSVATLSALADPLAGRNVDAAIAAVDTNMVDTTGAILEIGTISNTTLSPSLNLAVKKSGRTTGLTRSHISGLNATISVDYDTECAGPSRGTAIFSGQIMIANEGSKFLAAGDSGSLMVEDVASNPRAIGLLYGGSSTVAIANPIMDVLNYFSSEGKSITMVGKPGVQVTEISAHVIEETKRVQARHAARFKKVPGGVGHGIGLGRNGRVSIKVYVGKDTPEARVAVPDSVDGIPVEIEETGRIIPFSSCQ